MIGVLVAPAAPLVVGVVIMRGGNVPADSWLLNVAASVVGLLIATVAALWPGVVTPLRGSLRWVVLAIVVLMGATLSAPGTEGVHRWLPLGPVQIHGGALLLPTLLVALLEATWITSVVGAFAVLVVMLLQPDAAQAASFCAAWIGIVAVRREKNAMAVFLFSILPAGASVLRPDPLEPVPHVEGIVGMAAAQGPILAIAAMLSLAILPLTLWLFMERHLGRVLAIYIACLLVAAWLGNHPVPVLGYGVSPILGYYGAVAMAALVGRSSRESPKDIGLAPMDAPGLEHLRRWLGHSNVSRWWGDPEESLAAVTRHPSDDQALITLAGRPVGYLLWQRLDHASMAAAGLGTLPADHVDVDILIGEPESMGRGMGPAALQLILDRLGAEGVSSVGVGTDLANQRARRAFEKAGFRLFRQFEENGRSMCYLIREPGSAPAPRGPG